MYSPPGGEGRERKFTVTMPPEKPDTTPTPDTLDVPDEAKKRSIGSMLLKWVTGREIVKVSRFDPKKPSPTKRKTLTTLKSDRRTEVPDGVDDSGTDVDQFDNEIIRTVMASLGENEKDSNAALWIVAGLVATSVVVGGLVLKKLHSLPDIPSISMPKPTSSSPVNVPTTQKVRDASTPAALDPLAGGCLPVGVSSEVCPTKVGRRFQFMASTGKVEIALGTDVFVNNRITHVPVPSSIMSNPDAVKTLCDDKAVKNMYLNPELKNVEGSPTYGALTMSGVTPAAKAVICTPEKLNK